MRQNLFFILLFAVFLIFTPKAEAADLFLSPETGIFNISEEFSVELKVNTNDASINAAQAEIKFPNSILELKEVEIRDSIFNFWVEEPTFSNEDGVLTFIGGTAKGVSGKSLCILKMKFKTIGAGKGEITLSDAVVTASDGKGTNILSSIKGGGIAVGTKVIAPSEAPEPHIEILQPEIAEIPEVVIQLERIIREAVIAEKLPGKPKLTVPLYPDETRWYNKSGDVIVLWELPEDIIQVATRLSHTMDKKSGIKEEELFTGKNFGTLEEGIWYTRIQFKNNIGWGDLAYHKISLDMTAPLPFEIGIDNLLSDNPIPKITFETQDSFSGISHALIFIDNNDPIRSTSTSMMLPPQKPGKHNILVKVFDLAGNSIEDDLEFEVLPLPMPVVDFVTDRVAQGDFIFMSGSSIPDGFVDVRVFEDSQEIFRKTVSSDSLGGWEIVLDEFLPRGEYSLVVNARDSREAISYSSEHIGIRVKAKVVFTLGFIDLGWFEISIIVILLFIATGATIAWYYIKRRETSEAYKIVVSRDIKKISKLIEDNLKEIEYHHENVKTPTAASNTQMNTLISKMKVNVNKMKKYLSKEMEQLK